MATKVGELYYELGLEDSPFQRGLDQSGRRFGSFARVGGAAMASISAAAGAAAVASVSAFGGFDQQMRETFTLLPGISQQAMAGMSDQVKDFAVRFGVLPDEVIPALYQALSAGVPPDNVFEFLETAQQAAKGGVTELTTAVDGISSVVNAYGSDVTSAAEASDLMFTAVRLGKTNFEELSASLFNVIPTASSLGVGFADVTASMAALTSQGVPTSVATTQMRQLLVELSKAGGETARVFEEAAGRSFAEFIDEGGNVEQALELMGGVADEQGIRIADLFGSVEAGAAAAALSSDSGAEAMSRALEEMGRSAGATEQAFETMDGGIAAVWDRLKAGASVALIEVGDRLAPIAEKVGEFALDQLPKLADVAADVFDGVSQVVEDLWPVVQRVFDDISAAVETVIGWFTDSRDEIGDATSGILDDVGPIWDQIVGTIESAWDAISGAVEWGISVVTEFWDRFGAHIIEFAKSTWDNIVQVIGGALDIIQGVFEVFAGIFTGDWGRVWDGIKQIFGGIWEALVGIVDQTFDLIETAIGAGMAVISQIWSAAWGGIKSVVGAIWDGIVAGIRGAINLVIGAVEAMINRIIDGVNQAQNVLDVLAGPTVNFENVSHVNLPRVTSPADDALADAQRLGVVPQFAAGGQVPGPVGSPQLILAHGGETVLPTHTNPAAGRSVYEVQFVWQSLVPPSRGEARQAVRWIHDELRAYEAGAA